MNLNNLEEMKLDIINEINKRQEEGIIEPANATLLIKLIKNADSATEALAIAELGTTYKRTGFHFDKRLEIMGEDIKYFKKNEELSFINDKDKQTHKLIIGDNYDALLNLMITHKNKVDVIYIDPPYSKDDMGNFANTNYSNGITRDNLLSMLYPRLQLAKQLLSDNGVIFCSIDDKNQAYVKGLFDEIFGEKNFEGDIIWSKKRKGSFLSKKIISLTEHILVYTKNTNQFIGFFGGIPDENESQPIIKRTNSISKLHIPQNTIKTKLKNGIYKKGIYGASKNPVELLNDVIVDNGIIINDFTIKAHFVWTQKMFDEELKKGTQPIINTENFQIRVFRKPEDGKFKGFPSYINGVEISGTNEDAYEDLERIFNQKNLFSYSKPLNLIKLLLDSSTHYNNSAIILDFFAGSGTTGQAVMELNKEDGGNRQFILCTNNEITDINPNGIAYDVTSKRLKRVMSGECYDKSKKFQWIDNNEPYFDNLEVVEIEKVKNNNQGEETNPFIVIDETLYGLKKFDTIQEKINWVCSNFENTQKYIKED